jgi:hypothetical protein
LDHSIEPVWGIIEMLQVVKQGGAIILNHRRNEAEFEKYSGFHQWNFDALSNDFIIWRPDRRLNVTELLAGVADVNCKINNDFLSVTIRKGSELPLDPLNYNRRLRAAVLESIIMTL